VTRFPYEIARIAQDIAGGLMVTLPSEDDFNSPETGKWLEKYFKGNPSISTADRRKILRLIENICFGTAAVGYLTESMHGAGSPQAQRIMISRQVDMNQKKSHAKRLCGIMEKSS
jgi:4-hydroxybutyryl-CoA dehydratase/vinylacetyl-CoA-Delta-isomerase